VETLDLKIIDEAMPVLMSVEAETNTPARVVEAFDESSPAGLISLAHSTNRVVELPPGLSFARVFAREFVRRVCQTNQSTPTAEPGFFEELLQSVPPIVGAELLSVGLLQTWWGGLGEQVQEQFDPIGHFVESMGDDWHAIGRVTFHLAENKRSEEFPFAFLATYVTGMNEGGKPQQLPLSRAMQELSKGNDRGALLKLIRPVVDASKASKIVLQLLNTGKLYQPLMWTARQAYEFFRDIPKFESAGISTRVPDWWNAKRPPRPKVSITVGDRKRSPDSVVGVEAMLDFTVDIAIDGDKLTPNELDMIFNSTQPLVQIRGQWVEVDKDKLKDALSKWKKVEAMSRDSGLDFATSMRLMSGLRLEGAEATEEVVAESDPEWVGLSAGRWLDQALRDIRDPQMLAPPKSLNATLRPYQSRGYAWLSTMNQLGLGACLADDMGLGKTIQVIALLLKLKQEAASTGHSNLLVVPASLVPNWRSELTRFAPSLSVCIVHPSEKPQDRTFDQIPIGVDVVITTYSMLARVEELSKRTWRLLVIDEAQAIKNPGAKQTKAVKQIKSQTRVALSGTPVENRLGDLWSIFDFLNPGLLGNSRSFSRSVNKMGDAGFAPLRRLISPYVLRRLKTDKKVIDDLPQKIEQKAYCLLSKEQAMVYQQLVDKLQYDLENVETPKQRSGLVLAYLMRFKQACNHPDQLLGTGTFEASHSGKFERLAELAQELASRQQRLLVFTQYKEMTGPLCEFLARQFGAKGLVLHGSVTVPERKKMVEQFQRPDGPPFFVLSIKAGGVGLNLTQAANVIHFDRWWNPAVENQATDRAFRIGQKQTVFVHKFICRGTIEEKIDAMIEDKLKIASDLFGQGGIEKSLTDLSDSELLNFVKLDLKRALTEG
jgi:superfamily II DNA or RNA helicase